MNRYAPASFLVAFLLSACANPVNRVTSENYAETCAVAERNGQLGTAEQACYRALVNVDVGNLGPESKSQGLYNLARVKRQLSKFTEAQQLLTESLAIEEGLSGATGVKVGRRLVELSVNLAGQGKWLEGSELLTRALPITEQFSGRERAYTKEVLVLFAKQLKSLDRSQVGAAFEEKARAL